MLEELRLTSVGGISKATLNFGPGLIAVTGESGAGKSSLVRGLELLCGKRTSNTAIRAGDKTAVAEAFFGVNEKLPGLDDDQQPQEGTLALRREFSRLGRGKCAIQGQTVPLNLLLDVTPRLISIQSQFAQLELLKPERQMDLLDACGGKELAETKERLSTYFYQVLDNERKLRQARAHEREITGTYGAIEEIAPYLERLQLDADSEDKLNEDYDMAERDLRRLKELRSRTRMLSNHETGGALEELSGIFEGIGEYLPSEKREEIIDESQSLLSEFEALVDRLSELAVSEKIDDLESALEDIESKLGLIRKCKRLAKVSTLPDLIEYWQKGQSEMTWLTQSSKLQNELNEGAAAAKKAAAQEARKLHDLRVTAAETLQNRVSQNLSALAMENTKFRIQVIETNKLRANGAERIEFVLLRGDQETPVARAASGGELSRILLAIQVSLPDEMMPPTVVFDEVEAGLGGRAAYLTGLKLRELSDRAQVILITHEASIAALANQHYRVERSGDLSTIKEIEGEERVREIARMLSGNSEAKEPLSHARKLLGMPESEENTVIDQEKVLK